MTGFAWRIAERWLARRLPSRARDSALSDLYDDHQAWAAEHGQFAAAIWLWHEARSLARAYRLSRSASTNWLAGRLNVSERRAWPDLIHETRLAWRSVRGRGWRASLAVGLLALAIAVNTAAFSAADAFVFNALPFPDADRLVEVRTFSESEMFGRRTGGMPAELVDDWRRQTDLFRALEAWGLGGLQLAELPASPAYSVAVTPGFFEMIGVLPRWGRPFVQADLEPGADVVIVAESLAREWYEDPAAALGQMLDTSRGRLSIVGVMQRTFRFPDGRTRLWVPLDLIETAGDPAGSIVVGVSVVARLAPDRSAAHASRLARERQDAVASDWQHRSRPNDVEVVPLRFPFNNPYVQADVVLSRQGLLSAILFAAGCLLLTACANVASLELAAVAERARTHAVQLAIGATRWHVLRQVALEGLLLIGLAAMLSVAFSGILLAAMARFVPDALTFVALNRIDLDLRALLFMVGASALAWLVAAAPGVLLSGRVHVLNALRSDVRTSAGSAVSALTRRVLTATEVALATLLLIGAILGSATYQRLLDLDRGFDSRNLATVRVRAAEDSYPTPYARQLLADELVKRVAQHPDVVSAATVEEMLPRFAGSSTSRIFTDAGEAGTAQRYSYSVGPGFFATVGLPFLDGRPPEPGEPVDHLVVSERFAQRFWPHERAVGKRFGSSEDLRYLVIGVVPSVTHERNADGAGEEAYETYPPRRYTPDDPGTARTGGYRYVTVVARLRSDAAAGSLGSVVTALDPRLRPRTSLVDDDYAALFEDRLASAAILNGFGLFAFVVAIAGVYGVMSFLVVRRRREIGIRMALGADAGRIRRQVLGSSVRVVGAGVVAGLALAAGVSRWIDSYLFGVSSTDPSVYVMVAVSVLIAAILATLQPANSAACVDPAVTLRSE